MPTNALAVNNPMASRIAAAYVFLFLLSFPAKADGLPRDAFEYAEMHNQLIYDAALLRACGNDAIADKMSAPLSMAGVVLFYRNSYPSWDEDKLNDRSATTLMFVMGEEIGANTVYETIKKQFGEKFIKQMCIEAAERSLDSLE